jgi:ABC-type sugar transport system ATPase subunit
VGVLMNVIEFENFSCYYQRKKEKDFLVALDKINLTIKRGEVVSIVGPSGCGKTTLLKSLLGMAKLSEGNIFINGQNIDSVAIKDLNIGYVWQEYVLYPNLTIYGNLAFPLKNMNTPQKEVDQRVKEIASTFGITNLLTRKPKQLSGGQIQKVCIAKALIKNPEYILFDEPFANIDSKFKKGLLMLINDIREHYNTTMIFVTHDLNEAVTIADRIVVMEDGSIIEHGTVEELRMNGKTDLIRMYFKDEI